MQLSIYCDGSATTAEKAGGWGVAIAIDGKEYCNQSGGLPSATNNVAEITAAISGLDWFISNKASNNPDLSGITSVELVSDSQLVLRYASGEYKCKAYHLIPLYIKLRKLYAESGATTRWVRGHTGDHFNEICDKLAKAARLEQEEINATSQAAGKTTSDKL